VIGEGGSQIFRPRPGATTRRAGAISAGPRLHHAARPNPHAFSTGSSIRPCSASGPGRRWPSGLSVGTPAAGADRRGKIFGERTTLFPGRRRARLETTLGYSFLTRFDSNGTSLTRLTGKFLSNGHAGESRRARQLRATERSSVRRPARPTFPVFSGDGPGLRTTRPSGGNNGRDDSIAKFDLWARERSRTGNGTRNAARSRGFTPSAPPRLWLRVAGLELHGRSIEMRWSHQRAAGFS